MSRSITIFSSVVAIRFTLIRTRSGGPVSNVSFTNNHLGKGSFGYTDFMGSYNPVYTGNVNDGAALAATLNTAANTGGSTSPPATTPSAAAAPVIASFSPDTGVVGDGITNANKLTLKGTAAANSTVKVYDGSTQIGTATADATGSWAYITAVLTNAKHVLTATDTTSSGQTSAASAPLTVTVDTHVPAAPVLVSDPIVNTNHVQLSGTAEANSTITVYNGTTVVGTGTTSSSGTWSVTTGALPSGPRSLTATATDVAGTVSAVSQPLNPVIGSGTSGSTGSGTSGSTTSGSGTGSTGSGTPGSGTGTTAPAAPILVSDSVVNTSHVLLSGTAAANSKITVYDGTAAVGTTTAGANGAWNVTTSALPTGSQVLTATATDAAGNVSARSAPLDPIIQAPTTGGGQPSSGGQNLVTNGSFETGDFTGWTLGGNYKPLSYGAPNLHRHWCGKR